MFSTSLAQWRCCYGLNPSAGRMVRGERLLGELCIARNFVRSNRNRMQRSRRV